MPRDIPVGNGQMLVTYDQKYRIRDIYYPHVGQENHAGGGPCRFGVWSELPEQPKPKASKATGKAEQPDRRQHRLYWSDDGWDIQLDYQANTLATDVRMTHPVLAVELRCSDVVDFHRPALVRRIEVVNLHDKPREIRLFHHQDFNMFGTKVGDTAYFDPELRSLVHYRQQRYLMACFYAEGEQQIDEYATGTAGFRGAEGTWRDAEDGQLGGNTIAQGAVDSTMMCRLHVPPGGMRVVYLVIGAGQSSEALSDIHRFVHREGPQGVIDRTIAYWQLWQAAARVEMLPAAQTGLSSRVEQVFKRSLMLVRTQIDNSGAILAGNDSDVLQFSRDTYSYLWPRDGAFVADAMDAAGFPNVSRMFYSFCSKVITDRGCFMHKYNPDGSPGSSWHPWVAMGSAQLPIQEDETALVIWALWRHYVRHRDIEFVRPLWLRLIHTAADFMVRFRDPETGLPLPSYDLWEERWGVHAFTVASVYGGLKAAWQFAVCFGDNSRAQLYAKASGEVRAAFKKYFWSDEHGRYLRRIVPLNHDRTNELVGEVLAGRTPKGELGPRIDGLADITGGLPPAPIAQEGSPSDEQFEKDATIDSSMFALFAMGLLPVGDPGLQATMKAVEDRLWVKSAVGGMARYEDDTYYQISQDTKAVPGNPWFICTLWLADYRLARANSVEELREAVPLIEWVAERALHSGVLAEQVHPETNEPLSVSPLTWSHATFVSTVMTYLAKLEQTTVCKTCGQPRHCMLTDAYLGKGAVEQTPVRDPVPELT